MIVAFIDGNSDEFGVEPICEVLQVAPSTYYAAKTRPLVGAGDPRRGDDRSWSRSGSANYEVYGARKLWKAVRRAGHDIGRDQVARLMRELGIEGVRRGAQGCAPPAPDPTAPRPPDLVERDFTAERPNELWVTDLTYVPTWSGMVYVCFIVDVFSRTIVGWRVASNMRTDMVLDALEMARWSRGTRLDGLRCHSDAGSQFTVVRYTERLAEIGAVPSIGSVADSYDNALAETVNGLYKTELIHRPDKGRGGRRRRRARDPRLGALVQHRTAPRLPRRRPTRRVRDRVTTLRSADPGERGNQKPEPPSHPGRFSAVDVADLLLRGPAVSDLIIRVAFVEGEV